MFPKIITKYPPVISVLDCREDLIQCDVFKYDILRFKVEGFSEVLNWTILQSTKQDCGCGLLLSCKNMNENQIIEYIEIAAKIDPGLIDGLELFSPISESFLGLLQELMPDLTVILVYTTDTFNAEKMNPPEWSIPQSAQVIYKLIIERATAIDFLDLLAFTLDGQDIVVDCSGPFRGALQALSYCIGNRMVFFDVLDSKQRAGADINELLTIYQYHQKSKSTRIYALLSGNPNTSIGHQFHNGLFISEDINAIYLKLAVQENNFLEFMEKSTALPFFGFSVTMPLKIQSYHYINAKGVIVDAYGSLNTLSRQAGNQFFGYNTDAASVYQLIAEQLPFQGRKICIFGGGGLSRAIIAESINNNDQVIVLSEKENEKTELLGYFGLHVRNYAQFPQICHDGIDVFINATPLGRNLADQFPIDLDLLKIDCLLVEAINQIETVLLKRRRKYCITGRQIYIKQAMMQFQIWTGRVLSIHKQQSITENWSQHATV